MRQLTGVQTEATITHPSLPKLHLKRCMVGRLTLRCQSLETLEMQSSTVTNLHIQCPQLRYCPACASVDSITAPGRSSRLQHLAYIQDM